MPHVIVKLWPGKSQQQKQRLTDAITRAVTRELGYGEESVSVAFEEVRAEDWKEQVYLPDVVGQSDKLLKKPGYSMSGQAP
ncbi:MAG: tautomerase family protein [Planctomycetota bacterium]